MKEVGCADSPQGARPSRPWASSGGGSRSRWVSPNEALQPTGSACRLPEVNSPTCRPGG
jgi:hypothetical protein